MNRYIKNKFNEKAKVIDIGKANYSKIYYIDKIIKGCSEVADNGVKYFFWQDDIDNNLVEVIYE